jgi:hypothetical protein
MNRFSAMTAVATPLLIVASLVQAEPVRFEALVAHSARFRRCQQTLLPAGPTRR